MTVFPFGEYWFTRFLVRITYEVSHFRITCQIRMVSRVASIFMQRTVNQPAPGTVGIRQLIMLLDTFHVKCHFQKWFARKTFTHCDNCSQQARSLSEDEIIIAAIILYHFSVDVTPLLSKVLELRWGGLGLSSKSTGCSKSYHLPGIYFYSV